MYIRRELLEMWEEDAMPTTRKKRNKCSKDLLDSIVAFFLLQIRFSTNPLNFLGNAISLSFSNQFLFYFFFLILGFFELVIFERGYAGEESGRRMAQMQDEYIFIRILIYCTKRSWCFRTLNLQKRGNQTNSN